MLERLEKVIAALRERKMTDVDIVTALNRLIHSPLIAVLVGISPNKADDAALEVLKALFPKPGS